MQSDNLRVEPKTNPKNGRKEQAPLKWQESVKSASKEASKLTSLSWGWPFGPLMRSHINRVQRWLLHRGLLWTRAGVRGLKMWWGEWLDTFLNGQLNGVGWPERKAQLKARLYRKEELWAVKVFFRINESMKYHVLLCLTTRFVCPVKRTGAIILYCPDYRSLDRLLDCLHSQQYELQPHGPINSS